MTTTRHPRSVFVGAVPTAHQRLEILLEAVRGHPFRDQQARQLWQQCLDRLLQPQPVLDLTTWPIGLVMLLQPVWLKWHAALATEQGLAVHGVRLARVRHLPAWLTALPRLERLELVDCEAGSLDLRPLTRLRQVRMLGDHRLRRIDLPARASSWIEPGPFDLDIHVHGPAVTTCRRLHARAAMPETVRVHPDPGPGVDERLNLNQRVRTPGGRTLACVDLVCIWLRERMEHRDRVLAGEASPDAFDYRAMASPDALLARADAAQALKVLLRHESRPVHLVADSRSGHWLQARMDRMAAEGRSCSHYWLGSLHHAMALELAIETEVHAQGGPAVPRWVVRLYDPDHTTVHLEWFAHDRRQLRHLRLGGLQRDVWPGPRAHAPGVTDPLWRLYPVSPHLAFGPGGQPCLRSAPLPGGGDVHEDWMSGDGLLAPSCVGQLFKAGRHDRWRAALLRQHARRGDLALTLAFLEARDRQGHSLLMRSPMQPAALKAYLGVLQDLGLQGLTLVLTLVRAFGPEGERPERVLHRLLTGQPGRLPLFMQALRRLPLSPAEHVAVLCPPPLPTVRGCSAPLHEVLAEGRSAALSAWMLGLRGLLDDGRLRIDDVVEVLQTRRRTGGEDLCGLQLARERGHADVLAVWAAGLRNLGLREQDLPGVDLNRP